ncbi:MAG: DUF4912 domain-containing protein [Candidatus Omnitrophica bacterium]|nr:DUF4912 domain-containing protein [Candidatus Omnitrophota bacterium]
MFLRKMIGSIKKMMATKKKTKFLAALIRSSARSASKEATLKTKGGIKAEKVAIGVQEMAVESTKFSTPEPARVTRVCLKELPFGYGKDKIVLQVRDPWWIHTYWEVVPETMVRLKEHLGEAFFSAKTVLRVYDVSSVIFDGTNAHRFLDIEINADANSWYIDVGGSGRSWCVDLGLRLPNNQFITIVRSNIVRTPLDGPSWITDEEWMIPDDMFARLYGMGFGFGKSSPGKGWQERFKQALFSGVLASPGMASMASPVKKVPREKKFWLVVNTELIVYGATEPDAKVTVQGREINLRPDGTFSLRFALPDGEQVIPVKAASSDQLEERTITPIVTRETK